MLNNNSGNNNQNNNNFEVINRPTCLDIPLPYHCQRPVATVLCVSSSTAKTETTPLSSSSMYKGQNGTEQKIYILSFS